MGGEESEEVKEVREEEEGSGEKGEEREGGDEEEKGGGKKGEEEEEGWRARGERQREKEEEEEGGGAREAEEEEEEEEVGEEVGEKKEEGNETRAKEDEEAGGGGAAVTETRSDPYPGLSMRAMKASPWGRTTKGWLLGKTQHGGTWTTRPRMTEMLGWMRVYPRRARANQTPLDPVRLHGTSTPKWVWGKAGGKIHLRPRVETVLWAKRRMERVARQ